MAMYFTVINLRGAQKISSLTLRGANPILHTYIFHTALIIPNLALIVTWLKSNVRLNQSIMILVLENQYVSQVKG